MQASDLLRPGFHGALRRAGVRQIPYHDIPLTTYTHALPKERHDAADAMARLLSADGNKMETTAPKTAAAGLISGVQVLEDTEMRRGGRAVDCTGLENRRPFTGLVSSNLTLSANKNRHLRTQASSLEIA